MTDEYVVVVTTDETLVSAIQNATSMDVIHAINHDTHNKKDYYRNIVILDLDTVSATPEKLANWDMNSHYVVALLQDQIEEFLENYGQYVEDVWEKPISKLLLEKRLSGIQFFLSQKRKTREYTAFFGAETRNPISSVKGYAEVLLSGMTGDNLTEQQQNFIATIRSNAIRIQQLSMDMIENANIESEFFELHFMGKIVFDKFIQRINSQYDSEKHLKHFVPFPEYIVNTTEKIPDFLVDSLRLSYVFERLILNARESPKPIIIGANVDDGFLHFQITDFGKNAYNSDPENPASFSLRNLFSATKIIRHIINAHGGKMWLEQDDDSSTFNFTIHIAKENGN